MAKSKNPKKPNNTQKPSSTSKTITKKDGKLSGKKSDSGDFARGMTVHPIISKPKVKK